MKIYIASILQETNTLTPKLTNFVNFERGYFLEGNQIREKLYQTNTEISGFYKYLETFPDVTIVPGFAAWAVASGKITDECFHSLANKLIRDLELHQPLDGVLLALHGALVSEGLEDCEGYLLERIRAKVGPQVKIVSTLDYHAVVTEKMVRMSDLLVGFRTYPHVDFKETGLKAARTLKEMLDGHLSPSKFYSTLPVVLPVENTETGKGPMSEAIRMLERMDGRDGVMSTSLFCPQPWLDIQQTGVAVLAYARPDAMLQVKADVLSIMNHIWNSREQFFARYSSAAEIVDQFDELPKPVILVDSGDVISAGGTGDSTEVLRAIMESEKSLSGVISIVDPKTVEKAFGLRQGDSAWFQIGADSDGGFNRGVDVYASVVRYDEGFVEIKGASFSGVQLNLGRRVVLQVGTSMQLIVSEFPTLIHDAEVLRKIGIELEKLDFIVQKSHKLFRASYQHIAKSVVLLDTPGYTDMNLKRLAFQNLNRPMYPFDEFELNSIPYLKLD